jgi:GntR family transcriptional regulator, transcriptional repressor for pyruvate dehydrogenase complex
VASRAGAKAAVAAHVSFEPISRATLSVQIRDRLLELVTTGVVQPGERVASERALSEQFQVARTSVREAMQGLLSLGVIERRGNRFFVVERLPDVSFHQLDDRKEFVRHLFETRRLLELPIIELAAERATDQGRAEIRELAEMFSEGMTLREFREMDRRFHAAIARACGNPLLVELYAKVLGRLFQSQSVESMLADDANRAEVDKIVEQSTRQHAALARAVAAGDRERALAEGSAHLAAVESGLIDRLV